MNRSYIYTLSVLFLIISISCSNQKEISTPYFSLEYPSGWKAEKIAGDDKTINGISLSESTGKGIGCAAVIVYLTQASDPGYMLRNQVTDKVNTMMRNTDSGEITDTTFQGIPAKKINFSNASVKGDLYSGTALCFVKEGVTYLIYDIYPKSDPQKAGKALRQLGKLRFKKNAMEPSEKKRDTYTDLKEFEKTVEKYIPTSITDDIQFTRFKVEKGELVYSYTMINIDMNDFSAEDLNQWKNSSTPLVIDELKKTRNSFELIKRATDENYTFTYKYYDRNDKFLYRITLTAEDYNK